MDEISGFFDRIVVKSMPIRSLGLPCLPLRGFDEYELCACQRAHHPELQEHATEKPQLFAIFSVSKALEVSTVVETKLVTREVE